MKLRPRNIFALGMIAFTLAALALVPFQAVFAAHATKHASMNTPRPIILALHSNFSYSLLFGFGGNLAYHRGPVMVNQANVFAIFWEPTGSVVSTKYNSLIQQYFTDVGSSSLYHNDSQYKQTNGQAPQTSKLASAIIDTDPYPTNVPGHPKTLLDSDVQQEISAQQAVNHWTSNIDNVFFVFLASGEDLCIDSSLSECASNTFCGYHSNFGNTIYAAMPYVHSFGGCDTPSSPNNDIAADSTINVTSHEQNESATDPLGNAWFDLVGNEIGDKCNFNFGPRNSSGGDVVFNGHSYIVQREWDNARRGCVLAGP